MIICEKYSECIGCNWKYADRIEDVDKEFRSCQNLIEVYGVVKCKDCYAYRKDKELAEAAYLDPNHYCALLRTEMEENGYCSYGKKRR